MQSADPAANGSIEITGNKYLRAHIKSGQSEYSASGIATAGRMALCLGNGCRQRVLMEKFGVWRGGVSDGLSLKEEVWRRDGDDLIGPGGKKRMGGGSNVLGKSEFIDETRGQVSLADDAEGMIVVDLANNTGRGIFVTIQGTKEITLTRQSN